MAKHKKALRRRKEHRQVFNLITEADVTLQVLDARFPNRCRSSTIEEFARQKGKPVLLCINKMDLVPPEVTNAWKKVLARDFPTVFVSTTQRLGTTVLRRHVLRLGNKKPTTAGIVGYPNVGKSSLINVLKGRKSAPTSPRAGFTRHLRRVAVSPTINMIDTPGISPSEDLTVEEQVFLGTISAEDIDSPDLVVGYLVDNFRKHGHLSSLGNYLGCTIEEQVDALPLQELLDLFARKRGLIGKGETPQAEEAARVIIRDFGKGKIPYWEIPTPVDT